MASAHGQWDHAIGKARRTCGLRTALGLRTPHAAAHVSRQRRADASKASCCPSQANSSSLQQPSSQGSAAGDNEPGTSLTRRSLLHLATSVIAATACGVHAAHAAALAPPQPQDWASRLARALPVPLPANLMQPEAVRFPRRALNQRFAVLLMRSAYDAVDALDFIAMDKFQASFWKLRQRELEGYNYVYQPLKFRAGDLTDPLYFDFISTSQFLTISREMEHPSQVFTEAYDNCELKGPDDVCDTLTRTVRRPADLPDAQLPAAFCQTTGDMVYAGLRSGFRGEVFDGVPAPLPRNASIREVAAGAAALLGVFVDKGYALSAAVGDVSPAGPSSSSTELGSFRVSLQGPATLWGLGALSARRALVANAFDALTLDAWLRASGRQGKCEVSLTENGVDEMWTIVA